MKIKQMTSLQKANPEHIYLMVQGAFYHAYNEGADNLSFYTGYRVRDIKTERVCGFPIESLAKVVESIMTCSHGLVSVEDVEGNHIMIKIMKKS